ncbi:MAG: biotin--[acetyl-CoA-carboxylase] ligase [Myxococcales bacterium]|jgi:BirA family biotin operon repressor/biotin-[acetyl-CoA-carboxylase] ligase|nr:biotin--[acetyl-CoA-carboxylase] ligase [Myxococcales bacterium]
MTTYNAQRLQQHLSSLGARQWRIEVHDAIDSTSSELMRRIRAQGHSARGGDVLLARIQTQGRGRQGRAWHSADPESLYISVSLDIAGDTAQLLPLVPLCAGVAAAEAFRACRVADVRLKWPNDLMLRGKKFGGILCEAPHFQPDRVVACVGMGINFGRAALPDALADIATNAAALEAPSISRERFAAHWLHRLDHWTTVAAARGPHEIVAAWRGFGEPFGRRVRVDGQHGTTVDLTPQGQLLLQTDGGEIVSLAGGILEYDDDGGACDDPHS